ncbi:MAG: HAD-IA family hydrolase [Phycisphaerae bacterium]|nr:HAD-IA family hydrolase [Phycisphaerae bacterium]
MSSMNIQGIIFDMDGVLCDSEDFICEAAMAMFRERYDATVHPDDFLPFVGAGENRYIGGVAEKHGVEIKMPDDKIRTYELYLQLIQGRLEPLAGVAAFIASCREKGIRLAVASAADHMKVVGNLKQIGFAEETFDIVVTGDTVTNNKPDPEIFLKAAAGMSLDAGCCIVVEDAENGVLAAKAAGAYCLGLTTSFSAEQLLAKGADWIAPDLAQLPAGMTL